jgi:hypothetical protein
LCGRARVPEKEYIIFCDESEKKGRYYSNFYGGVLVGASQYERITKRLNDKKQELNLFAEVKWEKVTERYLQKYEKLVTCFFEEVFAGNLKVRVMFTQNALVPQGLTKEDLELEYYRLYYQFIKHSFGLRYIPPNPDGTRLRLYFDQFPDTGEKVERFKGYLLGLRQFARFKNAGIVLSSQDITDVRSHEHVLLQCLDVVLGAMAFRLNDKHKQKLPGKRIRGKRTVAKEKLYMAIRAEVCKTHANFNIGMSTGLGGNITNRWKAPYLHWQFKPTDHQFDETSTKSHSKKNDPTRPNST